jgi:hypothetical protein
MPHSEDDDSFSETQHLHLFSRNNITFPIEEHQSESVLDSMYESKYEGYESSKSPLKKKAAIAQKSMVSNQLNMDMQQNPPQRMPFSSKRTTLLDVQPEQESMIQEQYTPQVYLSLSIKGHKTEKKSAYKTIILDKQLQYENFEQLAKNIDQQLTLIEDDLIDFLASGSLDDSTLGSEEPAKPEIDTKLSSLIKSSQIGELDLLDHGVAMLNLMKKDIKPLLVVIGNLSN